MSLLHCEQRQSDASFLCELVHFLSVSSNLPMHLDVPLRLMESVIQQRTMKLRMFDKSAPIAFVVRDVR